jgi:LSU ribosomal protein L10AE
MKRKMEDFHISIGKRAKLLLTVKIWGFLVEIIMHGANYRDGTGQVFTRKEYIKGKPQIKIAKFQGGEKRHL